MLAEVTPRKSVELGVYRELGRGGHGKPFEMRRGDLIEGHQRVVVEVKHVVVEVKYVGHGRATDVQIHQTREGDEEEERIAAGRTQGPQTRAVDQLLGAHQAV